MIGYCKKCHRMRRMVSVASYLLCGVRPVVKGNCIFCGGLIFKLKRLLGKEYDKEVARIMRLVHTNKIEKYRKPSKVIVVKEVK